MIRVPPNPAESVRYLLPNGARSASLRPTDPARAAMTDLRTRPVLTVAPDVSIEQALQAMKAGGARFLFVVDGEQVIGSITSYDIESERPIRFMQSIDCTHTTCAWREVRVADIMDKPAEWLVLDERAVQRASVGAIAERLRASGRRYAIVVADAAAPEREIRGLFSAARIRQLLDTELPVDGPVPARTFAEVEAALL